MRKMISEVLKEAAEIKDFNERVHFLRQNDSFALKTILQGIFDPKVMFLLPKGPLPEDFKYSPFGTEDRLRLHAEARRMYLFIRGGHPTLSQPKREHLFLELLSVLPKEEVDLIVLMKDKKSPHKKIDEKLVREAFPGLLP